MFNPDTDFIFPARVLPDIRSLRGPAWEALVDSVQNAGDLEPARLGFFLLMVKLNACENCNADSFKAMRGCSGCSIQTIERFSGKDEELIRRYEKSVEEIAAYLSSPADLPESS